MIHPIVPKLISCDSLYIIDFNFFNTFFFSSSSVFLYNLLTMSYNCKQRQHTHHVLMLCLSVMLPFSNLRRLTHWDNLSGICAGILSPSILRLIFFLSPISSCSFSNVTYSYFISLSFILMSSVHPIRYAIKHVINLSRSESFSFRMCLATKHSLVLYCTDSLHNAINQNITICKHQVSRVVDVNPVSEP